MKVKSVKKGLRTKKLTPYRVTLLLLKFFSQNNLKTFSYRDVAKILNCSIRQVRNYIRLAENLGYIHRVSGRPAIFKITKVPKNVKEMLEVEEGILIV